MFNSQSIVQPTDVYHTDKRQLDITIAAPGNYAGACRYIENKYQSCYGARINCDYENLLVAHDKQGRYLAAVGYRQPNDNFFLEHYLSGTAEDTLSQQFQENIKRDQIVEIGNLVSSDSRTTLFMMQELWNHLVDCGFDYVMLTCTRQLKRRFRHLPYLVVTQATPDQVPKPQTWGNYYAQEPEVITGKLAQYDQRFIKFSPPPGVSVSLINKQDL